MNMNCSMQTIFFFSAPVHGVVDVFGNAPRGDGEDSGENSGHRGVGEAKSGAPLAVPSGAAASSSRAQSATGETIIGAAPPSAPLKVRCPPFIMDNRFALRRTHGWVQCDECHEWRAGSGEGAFVAKSRWATDREERWQAGTLDASWYCLRCWAEYYNMQITMMPDFLGLTEEDLQQRAAAAIERRVPHRLHLEDERFTNVRKRDRLIFCDHPRCRKGCRGIDSGYFLTRNMPLVRERQPLWEAGMLDMTFYCSSCYRVVTGRDEHPLVAQQRRIREQHRQRHRW